MQIASTGGDAVVQGRSQDCFLNVGQPQALSAQISAVPRRLGPLPASSVADSVDCPLSLWAMKGPCVWIPLAVVGAGGVVKHRPHCLKQLVPRWIQSPHVISQDWRNPQSLVPPAPPSPLSMPGAPFQAFAYRCCQPTSPSFGLQSQKPAFGEVYVNTFWPHY